MKVLAACLAVFHFGSGLIQAQPAPPATAELKKLSLEELLRVEVATVTTPSKGPEKVTAAPGTVIVITRRDIQLRGYAQLKDVLRDLPGMETTPFYHTEVGTQVAVRGLVGNNKIVFLVNGMRVNPPGGEEMPLRSDFSIRHAEQIEVTYGPGSTLYGQDAIAAVINVKTDRPDAPLAGELGADGGLNYERDAWGFFGFLNRDKTIRLTGYANYHDSELTPLDKEYPAYWADYRAVAATKTNLSGGLVPFRRDLGLNIFARLELPGNFQLQSWYRDSERSSSEGLLPTFGFLPEARLRDYSVVSEVRNVCNITDTVELDSSVSHNHYEYWPDGQNRFVLQGTSAAWSSGSSKIAFGDSLTLEETVRWVPSEKFSLLGGVAIGTYDIIPSGNLPVGVPPLDRWPFGGDYNDIVAQSPPTIYTDSAGVHYAPNVTRSDYHTYAGYAEANWLAVPRWRLVAGARLTKDTRFSEIPFTPRLALIHDLTDSLVAKYIYTRAYIAPAPYFSQRFFSNPNVVNIPNPDLGPEKSEAHEINLTYTTNNLSLGLSLYYGLQEGLIDSPIRGSSGQRVQSELVYLDGDPAKPRILTHAANAGTSYNYGADLYARATFGPVSPWFSYSYVDFRKEVAGVKTGLPGLSHHNVRLGATWAVTSKLFVTPGLVLRSTPRNVDGAKLADEIKIPYEINLNVHYQVRPHLELFLALNNITDNHYALAGSRAQPPSSLVRAIPQETLSAVGGVRCRF